MSDSVGLDRFAVYEAAHVACTGPVVGPPALVRGRGLRVLWLVCGIMLAAGDAMAIEKLAYRVIDKDGAFELRRIEAHVVAETFVEGDFASVGSEGFRRLVKYIGGANQRATKIAMTAPVGQEPTSEKIAMTAPVGQQQAGGRHRITFVMPAEYTLETLPKPTDERIALRAEPERRVAVIRYSGFWSRARYDDHERKLRAWIGARGLDEVGEPVWARYDPPFMPWFLRRNEIVIEVREALGAAGRDARVGGRHGPEAGYPAHAVMILSVQKDSMS